MKNIRLLSVCFTLILAACSEKTSEEHLQLAKQSIAQAKYDAAAISLKNAIKQEPNNAATRLALANVYAQLGQLASSEKELRTAIRLGTPLHKVADDLGKILFAMDEFEAVLVLLSEYEETQASATLQALAGLSEIRLGNSDGSKKYFEQAISLNPNSQYSELAKIVLDANKNTTGALTSITQLIDSVPQFSEAILMRAFLLVNSGAFNEAASAFNHYLEIMPETPQTRLYLANALIKAGDFEKADEEVSKLLKLAPNQPFANQLKGVIEFQNKQFEAAYLHSEKAIQNGLNTDSNKLLAGLSAFQVEKFEQANNYLSAVSPKLEKDHPALRVLAITQIKLGYVVQSASTIEEFEVFTEQDVELFAAAAYQYIQTGENEKAQQKIEEMESLPELNANSLSKIGMLKLSMNNLSGIANLEEALKISPNLKQAKFAIAAAYLQTKDYTKGLELAENWIASEDNKLEGYNLAGLIHVNLQNPEKAEQNYKQALEVDENNTSSLMFLASNSIKSQEYGDASKHIDKVLSKRPDYLPALKMNIFVGNLMDKPDNAYKAVRKAYDRNNQDLELTVLMSKISFVQKKFDQAAKILGRLDKREITDTKFWHLLAAIYRADEQHNKVIQTYEDWKNIQPNMDLPWLSQIEYLEGKQDYKSALNTANSSVLLLPNSERLRLVHASLLLAYNDYKKARDTLKHVSDKTLAYPFSQKLRGHILALEGNYSDALPLLKVGFEANPDFRNSTIVLAAYKGLKQNQEGYDFLENFISNNPKHVKARMLIANEYLASKPKQSMQHYIEVLKVEEDNALALNNLAYLYFKAGDVVNAEKHSLKAISVDDSNPEFFDTLGLIKMNLGQKLDAIDAFKKAVELSPSNASFRDNLKKAKAM